MDSPMTLDHLVYGVPDLAEAIAIFEERLGLTAILGGRHEGLGTHNAILPLTHESYVELIAADPERPTPNHPRPFGLDTLPHPKLVTWAVRSRAIERDVERAHDRGYDPGTVIPMTREEPSGETIAWKLALRAKPVGDGLVPFIIDWGQTRHPSDLEAAPHEAGGPAGSQPRGALTEFFATHPEPEPVQAAIDALGLDLEIRCESIPSLTASLSGPAGSLDLTGG
jgi:hypothetical protein